MFAMALAPRERAVERLCTLKPNQNQFDAMVSLVYNIGEGGFAKSSVLKAHNAGDFQGAAKAFLLWNKARVAGELQVVKGLSDRRAREAALYLEPITTPQLTEPLFERILKLLLALFKR
jgi:lysozyme